VKTKSKKKYYNKYVSMPTIQVCNHFSDKFVPPCHVGYFINDDARKLRAGYICHTFYTSLLGTHLSANYTLRDKSGYLSFFSWRRLITYFLIYIWIRVYKLKVCLVCIFIFCFHFLFLFSENCFHFQKIKILKICLFWLLLFSVFKK